MPDIAAITLFAVGGSVTPGPNTIMVTASGTTFGFPKDHSPYARNYDRLSRDAHRRGAWGLARCF